MAIQKKNDRGLMGFYIALCCCVLVIGAIGYFVNGLRTGVSENVAENVELSTPIPIARSASEPETLPQPEELPVFGESLNAEFADIAELIPTDVPSEEDLTDDNPDIEEVSAQAQASRGIAMPVNGEILDTYSDEPSYNKVLGDWRTHNGIDIAADTGSEVICAADGEVKSRRETVFGTEVTVSHSNGYETIYTQIDAADGIAEGKNLRQGDVIGYVAEPRGEETAAPHLHFGVKQDGRFVNPSEALAENNA